MSPAAESLAPVGENGVPRAESLSEVHAGVIGFGLMGKSIVACLLSSGHPVLAVTRDPEKLASARDHIGGLLEELNREGICNSDADQLLRRFRITSDYAALADLHVVIESIIENLDVKLKALAKVEEVVSPDALIGSNTSAIPVSALQAGMRHPGRMLGLHWAEPAHVTRFMEIICGQHTLPEYAEQAVALARAWGKEPTLVKRDIRGFITNRIFYAMVREAFHLVEAGYATPADVDRSLRNDLGYWITFAGPFRWMDLTGVPAYAAVMKDLFPELDCSKEVPALMRSVVESGARGVQNAKGFYSYTPEQAARWQELFLRFSYQIRALALQYPEDIGDRVAEREEPHGYTG